MTPPKDFDFTIVDAASMPVAPLDVSALDVARYEAFADEADQRYADFWAKDEGILVWQRVRAAEVFSAGCRDMATSLRFQIGCLQRSMEYLTDAPTYLEPWYGIGTIGSSFGGDYFWAEGQSPAMKPVYHALDDVPGDLAPADFDDVPIIQHTLTMIDYFLEQTQGRIPVSWCDIQNPLDVGTEIISTTAFMMGFLTDPDRLKRILAVLTDTLIAFTQRQSALIGDRLARPGHGFASSRRGTGIGMSTDNLVMIAPPVFAEFCAEGNARVGAAFGGTCIHSCGNWARWIDAARQIENLKLLDVAFSKTVDPSPNDPAIWRDALAGSSVVLQARVGPDPDEALARARDLWKPGMRLIVVTNIADPAAQHAVYHAIHDLCR